LPRLQATLGTLHDTLLHRVLRRPLPRVGKPRLHYSTMHLRLHNKCMKSPGLLCHRLVVLDFCAGHLEFACRPRVPTSRMTSAAMLSPASHGNKSLRGTSRVKPLPRPRSLVVADTTSRSRQGASAYREAGPTDLAPDYTQVDNNAMNKFIMRKLRNVMAGLVGHDNHKEGYAGFVDLTKTLNNQLKGAPSRIFPLDACVLCSLAAWSICKFQST
jgi:hypothetical protein